MRSLLVAFAALASLVSTSAYAQDVVVTPGAGGGFVVKNNTGTVDRLRVDEASGNISRDGQLFLHGTTGSLFLGANAGNTSMSGVDNVCVGENSLKMNTLGSNNSSLGRSALFSNVTGNNNTAVGRAALGINVIGSGNTAIGAFGLALNNSGQGNVAVGENALHDSISASENVAVGRDALSSIVANGGNSALGYLALQNATGADNTALGSGALRNLTSGTASVAVGKSALRSATTGDINIGVGESALWSLTTGSRNIGIGSSAGGGLTSGTDNIYIGYVAGNPRGDQETGHIRLGNPNFQAETHLVGAVHVGYQRIAVSGTATTPVYGCDPPVVPCYYTATIVAQCPAGKVVIGGGCNCSENVRACMGFPSSFPFPSADDTWTCEVQQYIPDDITAYAICARVAAD